jgi:hypothetical protein
LATHFNTSWSWRSTFIDCRRHEERADRYDKEKSKQVDMWQPKGSRPICGSCRRPTAGCLCAALPSTTICNCRIRVMILMVRCYILSFIDSYGSLS